MSREETRNRLLQMCEVNNLKEVTLILDTLKDNYDTNLFNSAQTGFNVACKKGYIDIIDYMLSLEDFLENKENRINNGFKIACDAGQLEVVRYFLTSPNLDMHADIHISNDNGFRMACCNGHLDIIDYLLYCVDLKEHANIHANNNDGLIFALQKMQIETINYLLDKIDLDKNNVMNSSFLSNFCDDSEIQSVKYILTNIRFKNKINIHQDDDAFFIKCCEKKSQNIINYLVFNYNIAITPSIQKEIIKNKNIEPLFALRELTKKLNTISCEKEAQREKI